MIIKFTGSEASSLELQEALIALSNFAKGLRGGNTQFVLELTKNATGTKLVVQTFREEATPEEKLTETVQSVGRARVQKPRRDKKNEEVASEPAVNEPSEPAEPPKPDPGLLSSDG